MADDHQHEHNEVVAPAWKSKIDEYLLYNQKVDTASNSVRDYYYEENEVGLKHLENQSMVKITDEGRVDLFAGESLGISIDPETESVNIFGKFVNIFSENLNVKTKPNGFIWNKYYFNPELYYESPTERRQMIQGTKEYYHEVDHNKGPVGWHQDPWSIRPMVNATPRKRYSDAMKKMLVDLGLPID